MRGSSAPPRSPTKHPCHTQTQMEGVRRGGCVHSLLCGWPGRPSLGHCGHVSPCSSFLGSSSLGLGVGLVSCLLNCISLCFPSHLLLGYQPPDYLIRVPSSKDRYPPPFPTLLPPPPVPPPPHSPISPLPSLHLLICRVGLKFHDIPDHEELRSGTIPEWSSKDLSIL